MLYLNDFKKENYKDYIDLYNEFIKYNSDLIPDILEIKCRSKKDYNGLLREEPKSIGIIIKLSESIPKPVTNSSHKG